MRKVRISFLHLAPVPYDVEHNRGLVESALRVAAGQGADWVITPELCVSGYLFEEQIGTDWILSQPDAWTQDICRLVKEQSLTMFLAQPERDQESGKLHNTVFVINHLGEITGKHRKLNVLHGAEAWSSPGRTNDPLDVDGMKVGILVCADSYKNKAAQELKDKGARILVSPAAWGPGDCGPDGEWEQRTVDTGLPIMVCNRSGGEAEDLDYQQAESVVAQNGQRLLSASCDRSVVMSFDWDMDAMELLSKDFNRAYV